MTMKKKVVSFILLCLCLYGCQSSEGMSAKDAVLREVRSMIDKNTFRWKFVNVYRDLSTKSGEVYFISNGEGPSALIDIPPVEIWEYKGKYICYSDPYSDRWMSKSELQSRTGLEHMSYPVELQFYFVGVSKDGKKSTVIPADLKKATRYSPLRYPALFEYLFGTTMNSIPRFVFLGGNILVDESFTSFDSQEKHIELKGHITGVSNIDVFFFNPNDSYFSDSQNDDLDVYFATISGKDTLRYEPEYIEEEFLRLKDKQDPAFFGKHPEIDTWENFSRLIENSTFYIRKKEGICECIPVPYFDHGPFYAAENPSTGFWKGLTKGGMNVWAEDPDFSFVRWTEE